MEKETETHATNLYDVEFSPLPSSQRYEGETCSELKHEKIKHKLGLWKSYFQFQKLFIIINYCYNYYSSHICIYNVFELFLAVRTQQHTPTSNKFQMHSGIKCT